MNPFVNPRKRSISLPTGCKDLSDVLNPRTDKSFATFMFIARGIMQAHHDNASVLVIGPESERVVRRYKAKGAWREIEAASDEVEAWSMEDVAKEIAGIVEFPEGPFPKVGGLIVTFEDKSTTTWKVEAKGAETEYVFTRVGESRDEGIVNGLPLYPN